MIEQRFSLETLTFRQAVELSFDSLNSIQILQRSGALHDTMRCECEKEMYIGKYQNIDGYVWRCRKCKKRKTVRSDSYFQKSTIEIGKIILILYCHIKKPKMLFTDIADLCEVDIDTVGDWGRFGRESISHYYLSNPLILGQNYPVQIDESMFGGKMKYNIGNHHIHKKSWVIGIVEEITNRCVLWCVQCRDRETLFNIIRDHVAPGAVVKTDQWAAYRGLQNIGFAHRTVNHSVNFVADDGTHTQLIESLWSQVKPYLSMKRGTRQEDLPGYLDLFSFIKDLQYNNICPFARFIQIIPFGSYY